MSVAAIPVQMVERVLEGSTNMSVTVHLDIQAHTVKLVSLDYDTCLIMCSKSNQSINITICY